MIESEQTYRIGPAVQRLRELGIQISTSSLRAYDRAGDLVPTRSPAGWRVYRESQLTEWADGYYRSRAG